MYEIQAVLEALDVTKATGSDGIPARLLKETAEVIAPSLCCLFNKSLNTGTLPDEWKLANVVPVHKKGNAEYTENYRPISLLPIVSKVLERCVLNNIKCHLHQLVHSSQHGFFTGKSCTTNLIEALDNIGSLLDSGNQIDVIYLDMSKAFDKVNHELLLSKLSKLGFGGGLLQWFRSYLSNRRQRVTALGATSNTLPVTSGVPQGSILGPILFLLYVHDLPGLVKSSQVAMFADDTKIFKSIASINDTKLLQQDLSNLESWSSTSGLPFNQSKCRSLSITRKTKPVVTIYKMKGETLEITKSERDLGVWMSNDLTWNNQVVEQSSHANKLLGYIRRNARFIQNTSVRRALYLTLVRPHLGYATQIWSPQSINLIARLEKVQRRATKFILNLPFSSPDSYTSRLQSLSLLPLCYWHEFLDLVFFFKMVNNLVIIEPSVVPKTRSVRPTRSSINTDIPKFVIPRSKTTTHQRSFLIRTTRVWNSLADELKLNMINLNSFKSTILSYYFCALEISYDPENPKTFKTICTKCNTARTLVQPLKCCY